jgi:hypothetical protein
VEQQVHQVGPARDISLWMVGMQASFDTPPSMPLRTHINAITSQRSVWKRSGPVERARAREETTLPGSESMKVGLASRVSSRTSPMISPAMFWYSGRPRCWRRPQKIRRSSLSV